MPLSQLTGGKTGGDSSKTFVLHGEGHTLGNALKCVIMNYPDVEFCGYSVPHPMESIMYLRIQMKKGKAVDALRRGLEDLALVCDTTIEAFQEEISSLKTT